MWTSKQVSLEFIWGIKTMNKYTGFYIDRPTGNNIFSYEDRKNKSIYVPKLIEGTLDDV